MSRKENRFTWQKILGLGEILCLVFLMVCFTGCQADGNGGKKPSNPFSSKEKKLNETEQKIAKLNSDAEKAYRDGKAHEARKAYEDILVVYEENAANPDFKRHVEPYCQLGMIVEGFGQYDLAEKYYRQAMEVDPKSPIPLNSLGYCYLTQKRLDDAIAYFEKAVEMAPLEPKFNNNLGLAYGLKKDYEKAFQCFRRVTSEANAYYNMSGIFAMNEQEEEAKMALQRAVEIDPNHREAKRMLTAYAEYEQNPEEYSAPLLSGSFPGASVPYQAGATTQPASDFTPAPYQRQFGSIHQEAAAQ